MPHQEHHWLLALKNKNLLTGRPPHKLLRHRPSPVNTITPPLPLPNAPTKPRIPPPPLVASFPPPILPLSTLPNVTGLTPAIQHLPPNEGQTARSEASTKLPQSCIQPLRNAPPLITQQVGPELENASLLTRTGKEILLTKHPGTLQHVR